ncbi:hypothetical protein ACFXG4_19665 [Nocardia sp. NPDC059246]|uniref:hypothetical protein n=1 Tax=unclassified Nocardia TaxID=2637762 RepID=UPI00367CC137
MTEVARKYAELVRKTTGWFGAYPPWISLAVGDYIQVGRGGYMHAWLGSTRAWPGWGDGLPVKTAKADGHPTYFAASSCMASANAGAGMTGPGGVSVSASIDVSFTQAGGFVLDFLGARHHRYQEVEIARRWITSAADDGWWDRSWALVTEVIDASSATILISSKNSSSLQLNSSVKLPFDMAGIRLADPQLKLGISGWKGDGFVCLCKAATPLFKCALVKRDWKGTISGQLQADSDYEPDAVTDDIFYNV